MSLHRRLHPSNHRPLDAHISQSVFTKDTTSVEVGSKETTPTSESLFWSEALHVSRCQEVLQVIIEIGEVSVDRDLVLPLKLRPHLSELCVGTRGRLYVVHNVNVDVVEHHTAAIRTRPGNVVDWERGNNVIGLSTFGKKRRKLPMLPKMIPFSVEETLMLACLGEGDDGSSYLS